MFQGKCCTAGGGGHSKAIAERLIACLRDKGLPVVTRLTPASIFWPAEDYHQDYFEKNGGLPDCHRYVKRF